jgi:hypothetical protein
MPSWRGSGDGSGGSSTGGGGAVHGLSDIPILGDVWKGFTGDPGAIREAYDKQIQATKENQAALQAFLMRQKASAQGIYKPLQHMYQSAYGSEGIQAPMIPQASAAGVNPLARTYGGG